MTRAEIDQLKRDHEALLAERDGLRRTLVKIHGLCDAADQLVKNAREGRYPPAE